VTGISTCRATVALAGTEAALSLATGDQNGEPAALAPGAVFRDEVIDLAPLSSGEALQAWFDVVLTGHFFAADIPAC